MSVTQRKHTRIKHTDLQGNSTEYFHQTDDESVLVTSTNESLPEDVNNMKDLEDSLGDLAFADDVDIPIGSLTTQGVVQLSNSTSSSSDAMAATPSAVNAVNAAAVHNTGNENVGGVKTFTSGELHIGDLILEYDQVENTLHISKAELP